MSEPNKNQQPRAMWVLQTVDDTGDQLPLVEWKNALQMHVQTDPSCPNIEVAGEIKGKAAEPIPRPFMLGIRKEIEVAYADHRVKKTTRSKTSETREESPTTVADFPPDIEEMIATETKAMFGNQIKTTGDRAIKRDHDRIRLNVLALKYCAPEIQAIVKATIGDSYMNCKDVDSFMKAVEKGFNAGVEVTYELKHRIEMLRVNFKQGSGESLPEVMQRFKDTVRTPMRNLGMPAQLPGDEANAFILSLLPSYDQMRQRLKQNAAKLKKIPEGNHAYPAALLLYGPPENGREVEIGRCFFQEIR